MYKDASRTKEALRREGKEWIVGRSKRDLAWRIGANLGL